MQVFCCIAILGCRLQMDNHRGCITEHWYGDVPPIWVGVLVRKTPAKKLGPPSRTEELTRNCISIVVGSGLI